MEFTISIERSSHGTIRRFVALVLKANHFRHGSLAELSFYHQSSQLPDLPPSCFELLEPSVQTEVSSDCCQTEGNTDPENFIQSLRRQRGPLFANGCGRVAVAALFACLYCRRRGRTSSRERRATDLVYPIVANGVSAPEIDVHQDAHANHPDDQGQHYRQRRATRLHPNVLHRCFWNATLPVFPLLCLHGSARHSHETIILRCSSHMLWSISAEQFIRTRGAR